MAKKKIKHDWQLTSISGLVDRLLELPQTSIIPKFYLEWKDKNGYTNVVDWDQDQQEGKTIFKDCKNIWLQAYKQYANVDYYFAAKDAGSLNQLLTKIKRLNGSDDLDLLKDTFEALLSKMPEWYRQKGFSLAVINSKFNEIIADIKKNESKNAQNKGVSKEYSERILNSLTKG